jgi:signal transduction histidine kinase
LIESSEQPQEIFNNSIEGIFRISESGELDSANNTFFSILEEFDIILDSKRIFPDVLLGKNSIMNLILEVNSNGFVKDRICEIVLNGANEVFISLNLRPSIINKKSDIKHYDGSILDVTDRMLAELKQKDTLLKLHDAKREQEEKSQEALELKDSKIQLLAKINHELKTPINSISIFLHLILADKMNNDAELKGFAASAIKSTELMLDTLNKYLDFTKIEAGKLELEEELFNFRDVISDCISLLLPFSEFNNLDLFSNIADDVPNLMFGDGNHYKQVVLNFANNAIKFTRKGEVKISITKGKVFQDNFEVITKVSDTGRGIPEDKISSLFIPYQQINRKTDSKYGTGLGLIICQELVELLGGEIQVESKVGEGSVFSFSALFQNFKNNSDV